MTVHGGRSDAVPRRNRCRCGHYLLAHMRVAPLGAPGGGSYRLEPSGPCSVCGSDACARFHPAPPVEPPP